MYLGTNVWGEKGGLEQKESLAPPVEWLLKDVRGGAV